MSLLMLCVLVIATLLLNVHTQLVRMSHVFTYRMSMVQVAGLKSQLPGPNLRQCIWTLLSLLTL